MEMSLFRSPLSERWFCSAEGDPPITAGGAPAADGQNPDGSTPWFHSFEGFKSSDPEIWESLQKTSEKDLPSFVRSAVNHQKMIGRSLIPPGQNAKPEDIAAFKQKIYSTGVFKAPPASADKYEITRPNTVAEGAWSDDLVSKFRAVAHKHALSQEAVADLIAFEGERFGDIKTAVEYDRTEAERAVALKAQQEGLTMQEVASYAGAWLTKNVSEEAMDKLNVSGLGNHPELVWLIAKAGRDSGEDISITEGRSSPEIDQAFQEAQRIKSDKTHPEHEKYRLGDENVVAKVDAAYRRKFGTQEYVPPGSGE